MLADTRTRKGSATKPSNDSRGYIPAGGHGTVPRRNITAARPLSEKQNVSLLAQAQRTFARPFRTRTLALSQTESKTTADDIHQVPSAALADLPAFRNGNVWKRELQSHAASCPVPWQLSLPSGHVDTNS